MLRGWPSAKHASESRFNPLNLERILWLRKRRRRKRRRRRRRPRSPRSEFKPGWGARFRPGSQFLIERFRKMAGSGPPFFFLGGSSPPPPCQRNGANHKAGKQKWIGSLHGAP